MHVCDECSGQTPEHTLAREAGRALEGQPQKATNLLRLGPGRVQGSRASFLASCWPEAGPRNPVLITLKKLWVDPIHLWDPISPQPSESRVAHRTQQNLVPTALPSTSLHSGFILAQ